MNNAELINFTNESLFNRNGKIEGQRLNPKWLFNHGYIKESEFFKANNIRNSQTLYNYLNETTGLCEYDNCLEQKRFVNYATGYKQYCDHHGRVINNNMKHFGKLDFKVSEVINFVKSNGKYTRICQLSDSTVNEIIKRTDYLTNVKISERLYHIEHELYAAPKCKLCNEENNNFKCSTVGYADYCKRGCGYLHNIKERNISLRSHYYSKQVEKFENMLGSDYELTVFTREEYLNDESCDVNIVHKCGHVYSHNYRYQGHFKCPKCFPVRSRIQYDIFCILSSYISFGEFKFNDRALIRPQEVDILSYAHKIGIEYDSLSYHSTGYHKKSELNNLIEDQTYHLRKTEALEENGFQLFRIFSNEWKYKQKIWLNILKSSIIEPTVKLNRLSNTTVSNISVSCIDEFLNNNHLEGTVNCSAECIRIGTFHNDSLLAVMLAQQMQQTRRGNHNAFEIIRFGSSADYQLNELDASSIVTSMIGYFWTADCTILYRANRRWNSIHSKLWTDAGFVRIELSEPEESYFRGNDYARFKHIQGLTTEEIYDQGYRKIFDCGYIVYEYIEN